jgi:hypothetical protein
VAAEERRMPDKLKPEPDADFVADFRDGDRSLTVKFSLPGVAKASVVTDALIQPHLSRPQLSEAFCSIGELRMLG